MNDPSPSLDALGVLQGLGTTTFAALVYLELRDMRRLFAKVMMSAFPTTKDEENER